MTTQQEVAQTCQRLACNVGPLPAGIDAAQLLWAISGVESRFGTNTTPRHEPAYDVGGKYATHDPMPDLLSKYGRAAACSYGPWQVLLCNAPMGYGPATFSNVDAAGRASVYALNHLLRAFKPKTLDEIGECYNAGHITPDLDYTTKLAAKYQIPMPEINGQ